MQKKAFGKKWMALFQGEPIRKVVPSFLLYALMLFFASCNQTQTPSQKELQAYLDNYRSSVDSPAAALSISLAKQPQIDLASGTMEKEISGKNSIPVTPNSLFQIGSITKLFSAALILKEETAGKLSIQDTIGELIQRYGQWMPEKEANAWQAVTVEQLLNMTSGIYSYTEDAKFLQELADDPEKQWDMNEILEIASRQPLYFPPGSGWHYSDTNYIIIGLLLEAVRKQPLEKSLQESFFTPLKLKDTYYTPYALPKPIKERIAHGYVYPGASFSPPMVAGSDQTDLNLSVAAAAGAMVSNPHDLVLWARALFGGKVLPEAQLKELMNIVCMATDGSCSPGQKITPQDHDPGFGLGIAYFYDPQVKEVWYYVGETAGYFSGFAWFPEKDAVIALTVTAANEKTKNLLQAMINTLIFLENPKQTELINSSP